MRCCEPKKHSIIWLQSGHWRKFGLPLQILLHCSRRKESSARPAGLVLPCCCGSRSPGQRWTAMLSCSTWLPTAGVPWFVLPLGVVDSGRTCVHVPHFLHKVLTLPFLPRFPRVQYSPPTYYSKVVLLKKVSVLLPQLSLKIQLKTWSSGV